MSPSVTVFTNGCFDVLHPGHIDLLLRARALGTRLIVGLNSDASVRSIKGSARPLQSAEARKAVLLGLSSVDEVIVYDELTPEKLIQSIKPDILVKGGDWPVDEIIGSSFVQAYGGKVFSLPLLSDYSSTGIIQKMSGTEPAEKKGSDLIGDSFAQHIAVAQASSQSLPASVNETAAVILEILDRGNKLLICGNGGSAADAQHLAAEFTGRYETERRALPAIALTTDTSAITALSNDYGFERIFARQVDALANEGDCLIAISTSGDSPNVIAAVMAARELGCSVISMTGSKGKRLAALSDGCIMVPSARTARVQEIHIIVAHIWCEIVDRHFTN